MRVLTLTPFYPSAHHETQGCFIAESVAALGNAGVSPAVIAAQPFYRETGQPSSSAPAATWVRYFALPGALGLSSSGTFLAARILPLLQSASFGSVDLIHAHAPLPCGHAAALLSQHLKIPFVVSVHGLDAYSTNQVRGRAGTWCEQKTRRVFSRAKRVVCVSQRVREKVQVGANNAPTVVVYNGVDADLFSPGEAHSDPIILSVGNLIPSKGHDVLMLALAEVTKLHPRVRLEIIGSGTEKNRLAALARQLGLAERVAFLGARSRTEVAEALRRCTIFALPSRSEALGCVYLEAMSAAKPVIACHGQGIAEIIRDGENGLLVAPDNVAQMAGVLSMLLTKPDLCKEIGRAARRTILQCLRLEHQAQRLVSVYAECVR